jgi:hypothetical protein
VKIVFVSEETSSTVGGTPEGVFETAIGADISE